MIDDLEPRVKVANCLGREIFYREYGDRNAPVVVALHGLGGQGLNFDPLARRLREGYRVICPDMIGRGYSQWATEPDREYCFANYQQLLGALLEQLAVEQFHWVGTSMGGALGIYCVGSDWGDRVRSLVLNDIGPEIDADILADIAQAIALEQRFDTHTELAESIAVFLGEWAVQPDDTEHWMRFALQGARRCDDGRLALHHDPAIGHQFICHPGDYQNWPQYRNIDCPVLVVRGALSTVLTEATALQMTQSGPVTKLVTLEGWGHAPFLDSDNQIALIQNFLIEQS